MQADLRKRFREAIEDAANHCHDATEWWQGYWGNAKPGDALLDKLAAIMADEVGPPPKPPIAETIAGLRELPKLIGGREWFINNLFDGWSIWTADIGMGGMWLDCCGKWQDFDRRKIVTDTPTFRTREDAEAFIRSLEKQE